MLLIHIPQGLYKLGKHSKIKVSLIYNILFSFNNVALKNNR